MLENNVIESLISEGLPLCKVEVQGDGYHYQVLVISDDFEQLSRVKRQQKIYKLLGDRVKSGELHALTIKAYTQREWQEVENG